MQECKEKCSEICGNQKFPPKQKSMMPVIQLILRAQPNAKLVKKTKDQEGKIFECKFMHLHPSTS